MNRGEKTLTLAVGIACLLSVSMLLYTTARKRTVSSMMERAIYAVKTIDATTSITNQIPRIVARELANRIKRDSVIKIIGKKSVCFGVIHLFDGDLKSIAHVSILKYPLLQFDDTQSKCQVQLELQYDISGACGFNMRGDARKLQNTDGSQKVKTRGARPQVR